MDTQYRKNLKAVAQACKDYTDNSIEKLKWELGTYDLSVTTDSTVAYTKTIPTNTIKGRLNYIGGASKVSENLVVLQDVEPTTLNGITYSVKDGVITLNGTTTIQYWAVNLSIPTLYAGTYYGATFATNNPSNSTIYLGSTQPFNGNITTTTTTYTNIRVYIHNENTSVNNWVIRPMLVKGSTAPTEFKQGFEGMRSAKTTSVKLEGANKYNPNNVYQDGSFFDVDGTIQSASNWTIISVNALPNTTYTMSNIYEGSNNAYAFAYNGNTQLSSVCQYKTSTFTTPTNTTKLLISVRKSEANNVMLNLGSTALPYVPYIAPITKAIPQEILNDIRYGLGFSDTQFNKLDLITKHLTGEWNIVDLGSLDYTYVTDGTYPIFVSSALSDIKVISSGTPNFLSNSKYILISTRSGTAFKNSDFNGQYTIRAAQKDVMFQDTNYTTAETFKTAMSGVYLLYQTATQFDVDFSQYIDDDFKNIDTTNMTTATFENEFGYDVPSEIDYLIEEVKA